MFRTGLIIFGYITLLGCKSHTVIDRHEEASAIIKRGDSVVLLGRKTSLAESEDHGFVACVVDTLEAQNKTLGIIRENEFVDAMYPWFESSTAPVNVSMLGEIFENTAVRERFDQLAIKYLIWIQGRTETLDSVGGVACSIGLGGGGCFGFKSWDDEADYVATIWDMHTQADAGRIGARTNGTSYVPAVIVPLPLLARVKHKACDAMAEQIADYLIPNNRYENAFPLVK